MRITNIIPANRARAPIPEMTPIIVFLVLESMPVELFEDKLLVGSDGMVVTSVEEDTEVTILPETVTIEVMSSTVVEGSKVVVRVIGVGAFVVVCFADVEVGSELDFDEVVGIISGSGDGIEVDC